MQLLNQTPWRAERLITMDGDGYERLLVVVKATYDVARLRQGFPALAEEQEPVRLADEYVAEPATSSLLHGGEAALFKPGTDVIVQAHAHPKRRGDTSVDVGFRVGAVTESARVHGERVFRTALSVAGLCPSAAQAILDPIPIVYERAFGGTDPIREKPDRHPQNPVGVGFLGRNDPLDLRGTRAPNVESLAAPVTAPGMKGVAWGFGPIAPHWQPRASCAGSYDASWARERMPLLPTDFNPRYYQVAPPDQVLAGYLQGGELAATVGMNPQGAWQWLIPRERPKLTVSLGQRRAELAAHCDTVCIDMNALRMTLVWRATMSVHFSVPDLNWICVEQRAADAA